MWFGASVPPSTSTSLGMQMEKYWNSERRALATCKYYWNRVIYCCMFFSSLALCFSAYRMTYQLSRGRGRESVTASFFVENRTNERIMTINFALIAWIHSDSTLNGYWINRLAFKWRILVYFLLFGRATERPEHKQNIKNENDGERHEKNS